MYSSLIGKVQKSQIYAQEKERVVISDLKATFQGDHDTYELKYEAGSWHCSCKNFVSERTTVANTTYSANNFAYNTYS